MMMLPTMRNRRWPGMQWVPTYAFSLGGSLLRCCLRLEMNGKQADRGWCRINGDNSRLIIAAT